MSLFNRTLSLIFIISTLCFSAYKLPETITFAGKEVPLDKFDVNNRLTTLFNKYVNDRRGYITNLIGRSSKFMPEAVRILKEFGVHEDYAYIVPVESDFNVKAGSHAGAAGLWQLMPATARMYGMRVDKYIDERYLSDISARVASEHLLMLNEVFNSDPFLVLSGYNNGDKNVKKMLDSQGSIDFWDSVSNNETETYVEKIIVFKIIMSNPEEFGFDTSQGSEKEKEKESLTLNLGSKDLDLSEISRITDISYRELLSLNPHILTNSYKEKTFISKYTSLKLYLPYQKSSLLMNQLKKDGYLTDSNVSDAMNPELINVYTVKYNDTIESISFVFGVDWRKLAEINNLKIITLPTGIETAEIHRDQKLRIVK